MKKLLFIYMCLILGLSQLYAADDKVTIPKDDKYHLNFINHEKVRFNYAGLYGII